ncbi:hypothetical protein [Luteimonas vadosa]|uniref:Uncharacterized protein n=1 Tax=Luteimonas vadosa TaxID=1165507 RepID=A0ABP9DQA7_9GAMM
MAPFVRYWQGLSPALQRYYRAGVVPSLAFAGLAIVHEIATRQPGLGTALRTGFALAPVLALGWTFIVYLRFLGECDELERRIELGALAWAAGIALQAAMAALFLLDARLVDWPARTVAAGIGLFLLSSYALIRGWLHRRYA